MMIIKTCRLVSIRKTTTRLFNQQQTKAQYSTNQQHELTDIPLIAAQVLLTASPKHKLDILLDGSNNGSDRGSDASNTDLLEKVRQLEYPARPELPKLVDSKSVPSVKESGLSIPVYMLHNCAHIELNAVDVCCHTMILPHLLNYDQTGMEEFYQDFLSIAKDEARHFGMLQERLQELGSEYGVLNSHRTLWEGAQKTNYSLIARVAMCQLINEGRGLDSGPRLVHKLKSAGDRRSANVIQQIVDEEIRHVNLGLKWFQKLCAQEKIDPKREYQRVVATHYGPLPTPFNTNAREQAQFPSDWYEEMSNNNSTVTSRFTSE